MAQAGIYWRNKAQGNQKMINEPSGAAEAPSLQPAPASDRGSDVRARLRAAVEEVFFIEFENDNLPKPITSSYVGHLTMDSVEAYNRLDAAFKPLDHVPILATEGNRQVVRAMHGRFNPRPRPTWPNALLFALTVLS